MIGIVPGFAVKEHFSLQELSIYRYLSVPNHDLEFCRHWYAEALCVALVGTGFRPALETQMSVSECGETMVLVPLRISQRHAKTSFSLVQ